MMYRGIVIHGLQNGRKFGFPTANVKLDNAPEIGKGVYAVKLEVIGQQYKGMLYVGTRPTLDLNELSFEINILDFHKDIYDEVLSFEIIKKIRDEQRFDNVNALIEQLKLDRKAVRAALADPRRRLARKSDVPAIMEIINQGKRKLKSLNVDQWQEGYPNEEAVFEDIARKQGHVFVLDGEIIAYAAFVFDWDPYYENIDGKWLTDNPYVVVHRIAVADKHSHQGYAKFILKCAEKVAIKKGVHAFRIDTHMANHYMRNLIRSAGFMLCGIVQVRDGKRLAYEKAISQ